MDNNLVEKNISDIENIINKEIGIKLAKLRESKGLSQESLGLKTSKSSSEIAKFESGDHFFTNNEIIQFAAALDVDLMEFVK